MKKKRFSVEQIVAVLKQAELGLPVVDLIREVGITEVSLRRRFQLPIALIDLAYTDSDVILSMTPNHWGVMDAGWIRDRSDRLARCRDGRGEYSGQMSTTSFAAAVGATFRLPG